MSGLRELQQEFLNYLLQQDQSVAQKIVDDERVGIITRLNIYSNAYQQRLKETIETDHEELGKYLGDDLFDQMAHGYIQKQPSHYTSLRDFCSALPQYLKQTLPFSEHPILAELADFEQHLLYTFDAADRGRCSMQELQALSAEKWPVLKLRFHPSVQIFRADWNSVESWQALHSDQTPPAAAQRPNSYWLLWRSLERLTEFRSLPLDEHAMLTGFLSGVSLSDVCEQLLHWHEAEKVSVVSVSYLQKWLDRGLVSQLIAL